MRKLSLLLIAVLGLMLTFGGAVLAQDAQPEATPETEMGEEGEMAAGEIGDPNGYIRFAHFNPNVGAVDIYLGGEMIAEGVEYLQVSPWLAPIADGYDIVVAPTGGAVTDAAVSLDSFNIVPGQWLTAAVIESSIDGTPAIITATEDIRNLAPGVAQVTFINALGSETMVNFDRDGVPFATELGRNAEEIGSYAVSIPVDAGTYNFTVYNPFAETADQIAEQEVNLTDSYYYLIAAVGTEEDGMIEVVETTALEYLVNIGALERPATLPEVIAQIPELAPFSDAIANAGLEETLMGDGPYTMFLPAGFLTDEFQAQAAQYTNEEIATILLNHVVEGNLKAFEILNMEQVTTLGGTVLPIRVEGNAVFLGENAQILAVNIPATNGTIHIIDEILIPESMMETAG